MLDSLHLLFWLSLKVVEPVSFFSPSAEKKSALFFRFDPIQSIPNRTPEIASFGILLSFRGLLLIPYRPLHRPLCCLERCQLLKSTTSASLERLVEQTGSQVLDCLC